MANPMGKVLYQGCGHPGAATRRVQIEVRDVRNSVFRSERRRRLAVTCGVSITPILVPSDAQIHTPPGPVQNTPIAPTRPMFLLNAGMSPCDPLLSTVKFLRGVRRSTQPKALRW